MFSFASLFSFAGLITEIVVFAACVNYMSRSKSTASKLLFFGSLISILVRIFYIALSYFTTVISALSDYSAMGTYYSLAGVFSFAGSLLFCIGFVLLIQQVIGTFHQKS